MKKKQCNRCNSRIDELRDDTLCGYGKCVKCCGSCLHRVHYNPAMHSKEVEVLKVVPFIIEKNDGGTYAIVENPEGKLYGSLPWYGEKVIRSPFNTIEEARQRMKDIAEEYEYESKEIATSLKK